MKREEFALHASLIFTLPPASLRRRIAAERYAGTTADAAVHVEHSVAALRSVTDGAACGQGWRIAGIDDEFLAAIPTGTAAGTATRASTHAGIRLGGCEEGPYEC